MTRPLDGLAFQAYCRRLGLSREAQELLATVRSSPPNRNPRANHGNMPVWYPSKKMQCMIKAESHTVEFAFLLLAEYGDDVLEYYDQPYPPIQLEYIDKRGHRQTPLHTADYFVLGYHEAGWQECKPVQELIRQSQERPNRYVLNEHGTWRCPPGEAFGERFGLTYRVQASDQINWVAQDNWLFLDEYFQDLERLMVPEQALETLQRKVSEHPGITLADLHREISEIPTDLINIAIAQQQLYVDLLNHRLTDRERTPLYRNEQMARAFAHRAHVSLDMGTLAHPVVIEQGSPVSWDGRVWRIANVGETELTLVSEEGHPFALARTAFAILVNQGTFYAHAKHHKASYDQRLVREGRRAAYPYKDYYRTNQRTTSRHGSYAWSMAHIDHTELDLELFDSSTGKPMGRCWLTLMILSHPRRIVALSLSYDEPSYRSCLMVLRLCVKRFARLPTAITVDGGPEFRSTYFEKLLALYKIRKHQRPSSEPRYGAPQERLFGTMNTQFIFHLLGNTQASKQPRTVTKATNPKRLGVWTLPKLAERADIWAFEEYDTQPHTSLSGMTPREAYEQSLEHDGARDHRCIPYDEVFKRSTFPTTTKGTALVQPGQGVRMNYLDYWCEEMRDPTVERTQVQVLYDPFDVSIGYACLNGRWCKCVCPDDEFAGCSERELQVVAEELRKRNRLLHGRERVELTQKQLATFRRENAL